MILEIILDGVERGKFLKIPATQILIRNDAGTPICVAVEYGGENTQRVEKVGDPDFNRVLRAIGYNEVVQCDRLALPTPPLGARLIHDPRRDET